MKVFTTGQVAKICKVAPRTVSKWFDSGRLRGYRIPGSQDRRIPREYLIKFLKEHGMPLGDLEDEAMAKVLIVAQDQVLVENVKRELPLERSFKVAVAASGFDAGIQAESFHPDCIIVDFSIGRTEALQICQNLRRNSEFADVILIALLPDDGSLDQLRPLQHQRDVQEAVRRGPPGRAAPDVDRGQEGTRVNQGRIAGRSRRRPHNPSRRLHSTRRGLTPATDNFFLGQRRPAGRGTRRRGDTGTRGRGDILLLRVPASPRRGSGSGSFSASPCPRVSVSPRRV